MNDEAFDCLILTEAEIMFNNQFEALPIEQLPLQDQQAVIKACHLVDLNQSNPFLEEDRNSRNAVSPMVDNIDPNVLNMIAEESQSHYTGIKSISAIKKAVNTAEPPK